MDSKLKTDEQKISFCLGLDVTSRVMSLPVEIDKEAFLDAVKTVLNKEKPALTQQEYETTMNKFYAMMDEKKRAADKNVSKAKEEGDKFREENGKREGVKTTASGLQVEVLVEGSGKSPSATDKVKVHYEGTLINGKVFDSSYKRNEPIVFPLNQVISGWQEGLQLAKVGGKLKLVIPPELAYGERGAGPDIPPNSTLVFTVELLDIC